MGVYLPNRLSEDARHADDLDFAAGLRVRSERDRVRDDDSLDAALADAVDRRSGQNRVCRGSEDASSPMLAQRIRGVNERPGSVDHVIHQDGITSGHVADHVHHFGDVRRASPFVDDREARVELLGVGARAVDTAGVRAHDHQVRESDLLEVLDEHRRGVEVVDRAVEEALDLARVQLHRDDAVGARRRQQVADQARRDRVPSGSAPILAPVSEVRDDRRDARRRGALERIDHDQELHQVVVDRATLGARDALHREDVASAHRLVDVDADLPVRELGDRCFAQSAGEKLTDSARQAGVGVSGEDPETVHQPPPGEDRKRPPWAVLSW